MGKKHKGKHKKPASVAPPAPATGKDERPLDIFAPSSPALPSLLDDGGDAAQHPTEPPMTVASAPSFQRPTEPPMTVASAPSFQHPSEPPATVVDVETFAAAPAHRNGAPVSSQP